MPTIRCQCNQVRISIPFPPVRRLECCCCDCRKSLKLFADQGGPTPEPLADVVYFPNALRVDSGMEHLRSFLVREGSNTRRIVAECCWTCVLCDHPSYDGIRFATYNRPAFVHLGDMGPLRPPDGRIFQQDMTQEELATLPPEPRGTPDRGKKEATVGAKAALDTLSTVEGEFITIQTLLQSIEHLETMDPQHDGPEPFWNRMQPGSSS